MNCCSKKLMLGVGRLVTTEYRVLPNIRYTAEPSNRTEYRFSHNKKLRPGLLIAVAPRYRYCSGATSTVKSSLRLFRPPLTQTQRGLHDHKKKFTKQNK